MCVSVCDFVCVADLNMKRLFSYLCSPAVARPGHDYSTCKEGKLEVRLYSLKINESQRRGRRGEVE